MDATTAVIETCETMESYTALMERETEAASAMRLEEVTRLGDTKTALGKKLDHQIMVLRHNKAVIAQLDAELRQRLGHLWERLDAAAEANHGRPEAGRSRHPAGDRHRRRCDEAEAAAGCYQRIWPAERPLSDRPGAAVDVGGGQYHAVIVAVFGAGGGERAGREASRPFCFSRASHAGHRAKTSRTATGRAEEAGRNFSKINGL